MLYFAYGSNMNTSQMAFRCPGAEALGPAMLPAFRLAERRYADIDPDPDVEVWGVLWRITDEHLDGLDIYEGYPRFYTRYSTEVIHLDPDTGDRTPLPALVYEMTGRAKAERSGEPFPEHYREACSEGARQNRVPVNGFAL